MKTIVFAVGARPNFIKAAPVIEALQRRRSLRLIVVHTGQHYDQRLSNDILVELGFPAPDHFLGIGSGTHAEQTGNTLIR
nr:UDP-N-acetylglucosamine 2-epimerase [Actinomycetota bacterium]